MKRIQAEELVMAGGADAAIVPCLKCAGPAHRTCEGLEDDCYRCGTCGFEFGVDWSQDGPPLTPRWPISEEEAEKIREMAGLIFGTGRGFKDDTKTIQRRSKDDPKTMDRPNRIK